MEMYQKCEERKGVNSFFGINLVLHILLGPSEYGFLSICLTAYLRHPNHETSFPVGRDCLLIGL